MEWWNYEENKVNYCNNEEDNIHTNEDSNNNEASANNNCDFSTNMPFSSREHLLDWVRDVGYQNGYVIVINRSSWGDYAYVELKCDLGGTYRGKKSRTDSATRKCNCPFKLKGKYVKVEGCWRLKVLCDAHNHGPALSIEDHPYARRLSFDEAFDEALLMEDLSSKNLKPRNILPILKKQNADNVSILETIYKARQKSQNEKRDGRKLDLSPSTSLEDDDPDCEFEVKMFKVQFKKQSRAGKFSFLKKIRKIWKPSATLMCEPAIQKTTRVPNRRRCPDLPVPTQVPNRRSCSDLPVPAQVPNRRSCSPASKKFKVCDSQFPEPARHNYYFDRQYSSHPYINQLPKIFRPFVTEVQDVRSDGNCGFRAIAVCLGLHETLWPTIRSNLMDELETNKEKYVQIFGEDYWSGLQTSLNFFDTSRGAPLGQWMTTDMGLIIASRYNVILNILSTRGSLTYLPLRSSPPPWYEQLIIAIGLVGGNHFVKVTLADGHPMPTITPEWCYFKDSCADGWAIPYQSRFNTYTTLLQSNCNRDQVNLD